MTKNVIITNGSGTSELINGSYTVSAEATGYDSTSLNPQSITIVEDTNMYAFTIGATGVLTLHVTEDGTSSGTPIVGATFVRTDSSGTEYGSSITTDAEGNAVFNNVPYAESSPPIIYYKQTASDGDHEFDNTVQSTTMTTSMENLQIQNSVGASRTISLMDANYSNLAIGSATITLTNS